MTGIQKHEFAPDAGLAAVTGLSAGAYGARRGEPLPEVVAAAVSFSVEQMTQEGPATPASALRWGPKISPSIWRTAGLSWRS